MLVVVGTAFTHQGIGQHLILLLLHQFLELGLVIHIVKLRHRNLHQDELLHHLQGCCDTAIQEAGSNDGFHGIGQDGIAASAAALLLAVAQHQMLTDADFVGGGSQGLLADHICPHPGQLALGTVGEIPEQILRHQHAQHTVAQELQPLVAEQAVVPALIGIGGVGQGIVQQLDVLKAVANGIFQILDHSAASSSSFSWARAASSSSEKLPWAAWMAWRMPLRKARGSELPWHLMTGCLMPKN